MNDSSSDLERSDVRAVHRRDVGRIFRFLFVAALVAVLVIVALDNRTDVRLGYAVGQANAPVWIVLVASAVVGMVIGWLARRRHRNI